MSGMALRDVHANTSQKSLKWLNLATLLESTGDSFSRSLLPIIAVSFLGAGAGTVGVINSLGLFAFLGLSLPIGVFADKFGKPKRLISVGTLARAITTLCGFILWLSGILQGTSGITVLMILALCTGVADVLFTAGQSLLIPQLVQEEEIRPAYGKIQTLSQIGSSIGPLTLSVVLSFVIAPFAWVFSSFLYLSSFLTRYGISAQVEEVVPKERKSPFHHLIHGSKTLFSHRDLAFVTVSNTLINAGTMAANTLVPVIALSHFSIPPSTYAFAAVLGSGAGILGALCASKLTGRLGLRATRVIVANLLVVGALLIFLLITGIIDSLPFVWICVQYMHNGASAAIVMVSGSDIAPKVVNSEILGTVLGASRTMLLGVMPLSAILFGALGSTLGAGFATACWLGLTVLAVIPNLFLKKSSIL